MGGLMWSFLVTFLAVVLLNNVVEGEVVLMDLSDDWDVLDKVISNKIDIIDLVEEEAVLMDLIDDRVVPEEIFNNEDDFIDMTEEEAVLMDIIDDREVPDDILNNEDYARKNTNETAKDEITWETSYMFLPRIQPVVNIPQLMRGPRMKTRTKAEKTTRNDITRDQISRSRPHVAPSGRPFNILVEGNVGSGKSTLLRILQERRGVHVFPEPVESWQQVGSQNLLLDMYTDPTRWTSTFQLFSTLTRLEIGLDAKKVKQNVTLLERSLFSERYCFVQMLADSGVITPGEVALLDRYFKTLTSYKTAYPPVDLIVYIRSDPEILMQRINGRGRKEESSLPPTFLTELHEMHENWLIKKKFPLPAPVVVLDGNLNLADFTESANFWADSLPALTYNSEPSFPVFKTWGGQAEGFKVE